jgi:hypothetical protein
MQTPKKAECYIFSNCVLDGCRFLGCGAVWVVRIDVSEERVASIFRVERIHELGTKFQRNKLNIEVKPQSDSRDLSKQSHDEKREESPGNSHEKSATTKMSQLLRVQHSCLAAAP